ncbi:MAG: hypothetical protein H6707_20040 [Deltaproteobacteria bacterium]|nr:hypothetical protein [Deltaproteobacteria bacterium]
MNRVRIALLSMPLVTSTLLIAPAVRSQSASSPALAELRQLRPMIKRFSARLQRGADYWRDPRTPGSVRREIAQADKYVTRIRQKDPRIDLAEATAVIEKLRAKLAQVDGAHSEQQHRQQSLGGLAASYVAEMSWRKQGSIGSLIKLIKMVERRDPEVAGYMRGMFEHYVTAYRTIPSFLKRCRGEYRELFAAADAPANYRELAPEYKAACQTIGGAKRALEQAVLLAVSSQMHGTEQIKTRFLDQLASGSALTEEQLAMLVGGQSVAAENRLAYWRKRLHGTDIRLPDRFDRQAKKQRAIPGVKKAIRSSQKHVQLPRCAPAPAAYRKAVNNHFANRGLKIRRVCLQSDGWSYHRDARSVPVSRYRPLTVLAKGKNEGFCRYYRNVNVYQPHQGGGRYSTPVRSSGPGKVYVAVCR